METAALVASAVERGNRQGALVAAIEYGTVRRLVSYMGDRRIEVIDENGGRTVLGAEASTGRYYIEIVTGGVPVAGMYLSGTAALMTRDAFASVHTS